MTTEIAPTSGPYDLTEEQRDLREMTAKLARERHAPHLMEWEHERLALPDDERARLANLGLVGMCLPEEYGGGGRPLLDALIVIEELAKVSMQGAWPVFEGNTGPARVIHLFGTEEQKQRLLPPVCSGEKTIAVSISEPDAGSAATDVSIKARIDPTHPDEVVINGAKRWCSGAGHAEQYLVYCRMGSELGASGVGAVLVDKETPGLTFGPREKQMGWSGVHSADMFFDDVRVPVENVIIEKGGFKRLFTAFSIERLGNSTSSMALAQAALDRTAAYVQERKQFGKEIIEFQTMQTMLADMVVQVEAARLLIYRAAHHAGTGAPVPIEASVAKCFTNEMAKRVTDLAIQMHGGYGYSEEYQVERMHRDAHGWAIAGGTPTIQRMRIASEYLGRRFDQRR
jgi:alkylation response protein AidB-like acyl-CoA dehydrogenase